MLNLSTNDTQLLNTAIRTYENGMGDWWGWMLEHYDSHSDVFYEAVMRGYTLLLHRDSQRSDTLFNARVLHARMYKEVNQDDRLLVVSSIPAMPNQVGQAFARVIQYYSRSRGWSQLEAELEIYKLHRISMIPAIISKERLRLVCESIRAQLTKPRVGSAVCRCSLPMTMDTCMLCGTSPRGY